MRKMRALALAFRSTEAGGDEDSEDDGDEAGDADAELVEGGVRGRVELTEGEGDDVLGKRMYVVLVLGFEILEGA